MLFTNSIIDWKEVVWQVAFFSPLLREVYLRVPLLKNQQFQIPILSETNGKFSLSHFAMTDNWFMLVERIL